MCCFATVAERQMRTNGFESQYIRHNAYSASFTTIRHRLKSSNNTGQNRSFHFRLRSTTSAQIRPIFVDIIVDHEFDDLAMARHTIGRLTALKVEKAKQPGMYPDGGGLCARHTRESCDTRVLIRSRRGGLNERECVWKKPRQ
jgi:hypothetical protein